MLSSPRTGDLIPRKAFYSRARLVWMLCIAMGLIAGAPPAMAIGPAGPSWKPRELVYDDTLLAELAGADRSLAFDHHGSPGIAFKANPNFGDVRYARKLPGIGWAAQDLFPQTGTVGRGAYASLAYDRHERPAITYRSADGNILDAALRFSYFDGTDWQHQVVDSNVGQNRGTWTNLAFDRLGRAAIAYADESNGRLSFVYDLDGDFDFSNESLPESVDFMGANVEPEYISMSFDSLNRPMITYINDSNDLKFAVKETLGWVTRSIDTNELTFETASSLAIDPDTGYPMIAYAAQGLLGSLKTAEWDGNQWNIQTIDAVGHTGMTPSIAFDPTDGNPTIAYRRDDTGDLMIAWHDGGGWQTQSVDITGDTGYNPSIAFREFGEGLKVAAIAYQDAAGNLYYIEDPPPVPEPASALLLLFATALTCRRRRDQAD